MPLLPLAVAVVLAAVASAAAIGRATAPEPPVPPGGQAGPETTELVDGLVAAWNGGDAAQIGHLLDLLAQAGVVEQQVAGLAGQQVGVGFQARGGVLGCGFQPCGRMQWGW